MKRAALLLGLISLVWLVGACSGGSNGGDAGADDLLIELFWAEPATGASPLRVTFTANITGGVAPYYYSWDFTNDGSVDTYVNGEFRRTISVTNNYYYRASDPDVTIYNAVLTVTDSTGDSVTSDPLQVNVLGSSGITLDANNTGATTDNTEWDEISGKVVYVYRSGEPVYFNALPTSGTPPYEYFWDFNADGAVDSTLAEPQYTYTNNTGYTILQTYTLEVTDADGEKVLWTGLFELQPSEESVIPDPSDFAIVLSADPEIDGADGIYIRFDPTGGNLNVPIEPQLDISVTVDQNSGGGTPPFEYYWDFENDGALDSQAQSPSIPYYDAERKILINPYMHDVDVKDFVLRCMVIDSSGRVQSVYVPIEVERWDSLDPIVVDATYGVLDGAAYAGGTPRPYAEVTSRVDPTDVMFEFGISGSTGDYELQFDADGDGNPDQIDLDGDGTLDEMTNDWYTLASGVVSFKVPYLSADYFPTMVTIRGVDTAGNAASTKTFNMPVSLVALEEIEIDAGVLVPRRDHGMAAAWTASGNVLTERQLIIAGGREGTSVLNSVQHISQAYTPPADAGDLEELAATTVTTRSASLNQPRYSSVMWSLNPEAGNGAQIRIHGGANVINGMLLSNELSAGGSGAVPWSVISETRIPGYYKLMNAAGTYVPTQGYFVIAGGLNQPTDEANPVVNRKLLAYDPVFDSYSDMTNMSNGRFDCSVAFANGLIYVIGGREANRGTVATVEIYNPATGGWNTYASNMLEPRSGAVCQVIGGKIYMIGGVQWPDDASDPILSETAEVFNPATGVWSYTLPMPNAIFNTNAHKMASVAAPSPGGVSGGTASTNAIVVFGGEGYEDAEDGSMGEVNRLFEFTYFYEQ